MYRRMVVVIGDQAWSDAQVKYAVMLAAETGAELSLLMVLVPPLITGMPDAMACPLVMESVVARSEVVLAEAAALAEQAGVSYTTHMRWGNTADAALRTAQEEGCDLIVIGSHVGTWRSRRLLRHTIQTLSASARQPLLVITEPPEERYRVTPWTRSLVLYDGSSGSEAAAHYACALAQEAALDVCVLHTPTTPRYDGAHALQAIPGVEDMAMITMTQTLTARVSAEVVRVLGNPVTAVVEAAAEKACDVIILGVEPYSGWRRLRYEYTAEAVLARTTLPVLLVNRLTTYEYA